MSNKIQIQQLIFGTWFNLNNLNQTFVKSNEEYFMDNTTGELYQILSFENKHHTFLIERAQ